MISQSDKEQFRRYAESCADVSGDKANPYERDPDEILRFWEEAKSRYLYNLLGEQAILSKKVSYMRETKQLRDEMEDMLNKQYSFVANLLRQLEIATKPKWSVGVASNSAARFYDVVRMMLSATHLIDGRVPASVTEVIMGKEVQLTLGQKSMRALGRIAALLNLSEEFEDFRIAHSQILNQKNITGNLCLSIHPLDYATASDNANSWSSCMSWQEYGCYRLGTVEMMNSPMVLCTYLTGNNTLYDIGGSTWNSKKWRAWAIVTPEVILVNRQYPYDNEDVATEVVNWIKELASKNLGWEYQDVQRDCCYADYGISFRTNYMYNDVGCEHTGAIGTHMKPVPHRRGEGYPNIINFSGVANCMWCGEEIPYHNNQEEANTLCCVNCRDGYVCCCCGQHVTEDEVYFSPNGEAYCCDCYNENFTCCDKCGDAVAVEDTVFFEMGVDEELLGQLVRAEGKDSCAFKKYQTFWVTRGNELALPDSFSATLCKCCMEYREYLDTRTDILYDVIMPYEHYKAYWHLGYRTVDAALNPTEVTFAKANEIFRFFEQYEDTDGSLTRVWKTMWQDYTTKLVKAGVIDF